jgi:chorismate mutase
MNITPLSKWLPEFKKPLVIAGPCSAESEEQVMRVAKDLYEMGTVPIFRAGIWKPRTRPNNFEGLGEIALPWLQQVKKTYGMLTSVEVATTKHVEAALKHDVDILWIGARTTANPFSVQEIADSIKGMNIPVMVKNPINADLTLWIGALERISNAGITKIGAIHRGFSTADSSKYRNQPMWQIPIELKRRYPDLPMICDPSHITGNRHMIAEVAQKAIDIDMDGLMIETHFDPDRALSDAAQQVTPTMLREIIENLSLKSEFSSDRHFETQLDELRGQIDRIDREILEALKNRTAVSAKIGEAKAKSQVTALQVGRMDQLLKQRIEKGVSLGLEGQFVNDIFHVIHEESVRIQTDIMKNLKKNKED